MLPPLYALQVFFSGGGGGGHLFKAGRLLTFLIYRMGTYLRWALIQGWAFNRINTVSTSQMQVITIQLYNPHIKVLLRSNYRYSFFLHFRVQYDFLTYLAKFQSITNIRSHSVFTFISENLRPPLLDLVPRLGCELEKMTSYEQKYLTG